MKCACSCGLLRSVAAVGGLVMVGMGGFNAITTGCPLGGLRPCESASTLLSASTTTGSCCDSTTSAECETPAVEPTVEAAAAETPAKTEIAPTDAVPAAPTTDAPAIGG